MRRNAAGEFENGTGDPNIGRFSSAGSFSRPAQYSLWCKELDAFVGVLARIFQCFRETEPMCAVVTMGDTGYMHRSRYTQPSTQDEPGFVCCGHRRARTHTSSRRMVESHGALLPDKWEDGRVAWA